MAGHKFDGEKCGDPLEPSNWRRAKVAAIAVKARSEHYGEAPTLDEDGICDLMADLMHLCDREKLSARKLLARAKRNWLAER